MDFQKLDPVLAAELSAHRGTPAAADEYAERELVVFVHVSGSLHRDDAERLTERLGLSQPVKPGGVLTMTLPAARVAELTEESWVVAIRAARRLRPLD